PSNAEVQEVVNANVTPEMFNKRYADVFKGTEAWQAIEVRKGETYDWDPKSTYIQNPPYFEGMTMTPPGFSEIRGARPLALLGDSITTDHISPAGSIK